MTPSKGDADRVSDSYWERQPEGGLKHVVVSNYCPRLDEKYIPTLELDEGLAAFFRWKFKEQPAKDARWARDYYRSKGAIVTKARRDDGTVVKVYTLPPQK